MAKKFKVYLRDHFKGEVTALDERNSISILKVWPEEHEASGQILAYFVIASPTERDNLWKSGLACNRAAAMGLLAPPLSKGQAPVMYDDPVPDHHKLDTHDEILDDPVDVQGFEDEFELTEEEDNVVDDFDVSLGSAPAPVPVPSVLGGDAEKTAEPSSLAKQDLSDVISLSAPIRARLKQAGLVTVQDAIDKSVDDLRALPGIGKLTSEKLFDALNTFRENA